VSVKPNGGDTNVPVGIRICKIRCTKQVSYNNDLSISGGSDKANAVNMGYLDNSGC
jgi:hypothetical protein